MSDNDQAVDKNLTNNKVFQGFKSRIIGTNKLFKIVNHSKEDEARKEEMIAALEAQLIPIRQQLANKDAELKQSMSEKNNLAKQLATYKSSKLQSLVDNLQTRLSQAEAANTANQKVLESKNMYIQQLEAVSEKIKEDNNVNKNSKATEKHRQDMAKKNNSIKSLQDQVAGMEKTIDDLNKKLEKSEEEFEKLDMEYMELKTDVEMSNDSKDDVLQQKVSELEAAQLASNRKMDQLKTTLAEVTADRAKWKKVYESSESKVRHLVDSNKEANSIKPKYQKLQHDNQMLQNDHQKLLKDNQNLQADRKQLKDDLESSIKDLHLSRANNLVLQKAHDRLSQHGDAMKQTSHDFKKDQVSPALLQKLRYWKTTNAILKEENKYLKIRVTKLNTKINKSQNLEDLLQTSSEEDSSSEELNYISDNPSEVAPRKKLSAKIPSAKPISQLAISRSPLTTVINTASSARPLISPTASTGPATSPNSFTILARSPTSFIAPSTSPLVHPLSDSEVKRKLSATSLNVVTYSTSPTDRESSLNVSPTSIKSGPSSNVSPSSTKPASPSNVSSTSTKPGPSSNISNTPTLSNKRSKKHMETMEKDRPPMVEPPRKTSASKLYIPPPSRPIAIPKCKKPTNKLVKFANSRNPSKLINNKPIISVVHTKHVAADAPVEGDIAVKKPRLDTRFADQIKTWIKNHKHVRSNDLEVDDILKEVFTNYSVMKSSSDPNPNALSTYGVEAYFVINVPDKWDGREKAYAWILSLYSAKERKKFDYIYAEVTKEFKTVLKSKRPDACSARYCRLLSVLCKSANGFERMRSICFDVVRHSPSFATTVLCLFNIACGWKESLTRYNDPSVFLTTLQSCTAAIMSKSKVPDNIKNMYNKLSTSCNWPDLKDSPTPDKATDLVLQRLLTIDQVKDPIMFGRLRFEIIRSLEMIFHVIGDWKKMYNEFILNKLWPLLTRDIVDDLALETMAVLGSFGLSQDPLKEDKPGVEHLFNIMLQVASVAVVGDDGRDIQLTATKGAWMLGANDPSRVARIKQCVESIGRTEK